MAGALLNNSMASRIATAAPAPMVAPVASSWLIGPLSSSHEVSISRPTGTAAE